MADTTHHVDDAVTGGAPGDLAAFAQDTAIVLVWLALAVLYLLAGRAAVLRGRTNWPLRRSVSWLAGIGLGLTVTVGPLERAATGSFTAHMLVHLVLGMAVPLLLVLAAPVTLFLRAAPVRMGRRYSRLASTRTLRLLADPVVAMVLSTAPMALLYSDGAAIALLHHALLGPLLHVHFVASGALFAYAVVGVDPNPHRSPAWVRAGAIMTAIAVHGIVAKRLYASANGGALPPDAEQAAQLMYYGGDAVHVLLLVVFCSQVYREGGRRLRQAEVRALATPRVV